MYDWVLMLNLPDKIKIFGFADDIAIIVMAKHLDEIESTLNESVTNVKKWIDSVGLTVAEH